MFAQLATGRAARPAFGGRQHVLQHKPSSKHGRGCPCSGCRRTTAKATLVVKVNDTEVKLSNLDTSSTIELDMSTNGSPPEPAPAADTAAAEPAADAAPGPASATHLAQRVKAVQAHLPGAMAVDDFLARVEVVLCAHGFRGDNSIGCCNVCRDESTGVLKSKIDAIFGQNFNINGLGAVLTCGVTGMGAGLSHAPVDPETKREKYVFFSFPHIAVDQDGKVGAIHRPGREGESAACGALLTSLKALQADGLDKHLKDPGVHDSEEPEYSILRQRVARRVAAEGADLDQMDLVKFTKIAERSITSDLQYLISKAVKTEKADYAVVTGIQVHSWPDPKTGLPAIEFVAPTQVYTVVNGKKTMLDVQKVPALTPRQTAILAAAGTPAAGAGAYLAGSCVVEVDQPDPAGNPAMDGVDPVRTSVVFKQLLNDSSPKQADHEVPEWASTYCC